MRSVVLLLSLPSVAWAADLEVPAQYPTIADAIAAAAPGDVLRLAPGVYDELVQLDRDLTLVAPTGGVTLQWSQPSAELAVITVLPGVDVTLQGVRIASTTHRALYADSAARVSLIEVDASDFTAVDEGGAIFVRDTELAITDSTFSGNRANHGGAIALRATALAKSALIMSGSTFSDNAATDLGGHISADGAVVIDVIDSTFSAGDAVSGGALHLNALAYDPFVRDSMLDSNVASGDGGAIALTASNFLLDVSGSSFLDNRAGQHGGALFIDQGRVLTATDSVFARNQAENGGAIAFRDTRRLELVRVLACQNAATGAGGAVWAEGVIGRATLTNNALFANSAGTDGGALWFANAANVNLNFVTSRDNAASAGDHVAGNLIAGMTVRNSAFTGSVSPVVAIQGSLLSSDFRYNLWDAPAPPLGGAALTAITLDATNLFGAATYAAPLVEPCEQAALWPTWTSPAVDAGDPTRFDPDGSRADIGAFGGPDADALAHTDADGDGASQIRDCDDTRDSAFPGADEQCNGVDDDCDGVIDNDPAGPIWHPDLDGDGYGDGGIAGIAACEAPGPNFVSNRLDCDDDNGSINPDAIEVCNGIDDDCDGLIDGNAVDQSIFYRDADADGFGRDQFEARACTAPAGYATVGGDCDDARDFVYPGAEERCNSRDDDCNGAIDDDPVDGTPWYRDADDDGFGSGEGSLASCTPPGTGFVQAPGDCDDARDDVFPEAPELCDGVDNNCDGDIDLNPTFSLWYPDTDEDGAGDAAAVGIAACEQPGVGLVLDARDCDDADSDIGPHAEERCDGIDNDCNGSVDGGDAVDALTFYFDGDRDSYGDPNRTTLACALPTLHVVDAGDCNDTNAAVNPAEPERCNGLDDNCDGLVDGDDAVDATTWFRDADEDNFGDATRTTVACDQPDGYNAVDGDCDDSDAAISPIATEICDEIDNTCDGSIDGPDAIDGTVWFEDVDGDGFGDVNSPLRACTVPDGYVDNSRDCDDTDPAVNPDATEINDNLVDENCDGLIADSPPIEVEEGCGCSSLSSAGGGPRGAVFALLLVAALVRRRRQ